MDASIDQWLYLITGTSDRVCGTGRAAALSWGKRSGRPQAPAPLGRCQSRDAEPPECRPLLAMRWPIRFVRYTINLLYIFMALTAGKNTGALYFIHAQEDSHVPPGLAWSHNFFLLWPRKARIKRSIGIAKLIDHS